MISCALLDHCSAEQKGLSTSWELINFRLQSIPVLALWIATSSSSQVMNSRASLSFVASSPFILDNSHRVSHARHSSSLRRRPRSPSWRGVSCLEYACSQYSRDHNASSDGGAAAPRPSDQSDSKTSSTASSSELESPTFHSLYGSRIPIWLHKRLEHMCFVHPTSVQCAVLPVALPAPEASLGDDVVIHAQTGSGKTLAYLIPALAGVDPHRSSTQALVVVPTQELGMQVYKLLRRLVSSYPYAATSHSLQEGLGLENSDEDATDMKAEREHMSFPVLPMLDQADLRRQKLQLRQVAPRVIVGNPHRVAELVDCGRLRLDLLKVLVVDEFDACLLDTSTTNALQTILSVRGREGPRQTILASATVPQHRHFLRQCVRQRWTRSDIEHVWVEGNAGERVPTSLSHFYALCRGEKKLAALRALLLRFGSGGPGDESGLSIRAIVFVMPSRHISEIVDALNRSLQQPDNIEERSVVVGLSDDMSIVQRREAMERFRDGRAKVLVGTDLAARGLDVPDVSHVFHFDLPTDPDAYLHRAGRAGRQGKCGNSVVLIAPEEHFVVSRVANALGIDFVRIGK